MPALTLDAPTRDTWCSTSGISQQCQVSPQAVALAIRLGQLPAVRLYGKGGQYAVRLGDALDRWGPRTTPRKNN